MHINQFVANTRNNVDLGLWLSLIIPILLFKTGFWEFAMELLFVILIVIIKLFDSAYPKLIVIPLYTLLQFHFDPNLIVTIRFICTTLFLLFFSKKLLTLYPKSFSVGEVILLSQLACVFILTQSHFMAPFIIILLVEHYLLEFNFVNMLVIANVLILATLTTLSLSMPNWSYSVKLLVDRLLCFSTFTNFVLVQVWLILFFSCILVAFFVSSNDTQCVIKNKCFNKTQLVDNDGNEYLSTSSKMSNESCVDMCMADDASCCFYSRKAFHFAAGIVFATGILCSPNLLSLASGLLFLVFWFFEWARRRGSFNVTCYLNSLMNPLRDAKDCGPILFTPISLLIGLSIPIWWSLPTSSIQLPVTSATYDMDHLCLSMTINPSSWSGVLAVAVGDSFAALVGRAYGQTRWPGTHRTILGSIFSFLTQICTWLLIANYYEWKWFKGIIPILIGVFVEAYTEQIDNLVVPLVVMIAFEFSFA